MRARPLFHLAFAAGGQEAVDAFYAAALAFGGPDDGSPGFRNQRLRRNTNYVAFVLDSDNNNIEPRGLIQLPDGQPENIRTGANLRPFGPPPKGQVVGAVAGSARYLNGRLLAGAILESAVGAVLLREQTAG